MGTRGALGFRFQGQDKVTYNHYDSYPTGLGVVVAEVVRKYHDDQLAATAARIELVREDEPVPPELVNRYRSLADTGVASRSLNDWYVLLREIQGELGPYVEGVVGHMIDSHEFLANSLFCEWAYIINMDEGTLEVHKGFNTDPGAAGRYAVLGSSGDGYAGVALYRTYRLDEVRQFANPARAMLDLENEED